MTKLKELLEWIRKRKARGHGKNRIMQTCQYSRTTGFLAWGRGGEHEGKT